MSTDNSFKPVRSLGEMWSMRRSSWAMFGQCPHRWMLETLGKVEQRQGKAAAIGTAVHTIVERFIQGQTMSASRDLLDEVGMPKEERENLWLYLKEQVQPLIPHLVGVEVRRIVPVAEGCPLLSAGLDLVAALDSETLLVVDHKTDRSPRSLEEWQADAQPLCYAYAARRMFREMNGDRWPRRVIYRVGYVNLRTSLEWETDPDRDQWLEQAWAETWQEIRAYARRGHWPALFGEWCTWCPAQKQCPTYQPELERARAGLTAIFNPDAYSPPVPVHQRAEYLVWLKAVIKAAEAAKDEVEAELKEELATVGRIDTGGHTLTLSGGSRREADAVGLIDALTRLAEERPDLARLMHAHWLDLFTAKVTALDRLAKEHPDLEAAVLPHILHRQTAPSIKVVATPRDRSLQSVALKD